MHAFRQTLPVLVFSVTMSLTTSPRGERKQPKNLTKERHDTVPTARNGPQELRSLVFLEESANGELVVVNGSLTPKWKALSVRERFVQKQRNLIGR